jgi:hypothetical protein
VNRARTLGRTTVVALLGAAALAMAGQPASATGSDRPVPNDPGARHAAPRHAAATAPHAVHNPLLKEVLSNEDDADRQGEPPALSALCQSYLGHPTPYRRIGSNIDAISGDTTVAVGSQTGCSAAQNETTIAVNPYDPNNLVAGSNDYRVFNAREQRNDSSGWAYTSFDGGRTWKNVQLPKLTFQTGATGALSYMDSAGDPAIAFGPANTVYYANLVFSRAAPPAGQQQASGISMSVSHDGGLTWSDPSVIQLDGVNPDATPTPAYVFNDKEWVGVDPIRGTAYVTWTRFTYDQTGAYQQSPIVSVRSSDGGRHWTAPVQVAPSLAGFSGGITPFDQGSNPVVTRDGTLQVAYQASVCQTAACNQPADHDAVVVATSRDGGRSFHNTEVATDYNFPTNEDAGTGTLTGENFRINSFPQLTVDRVTDRLWVTWADDRNGRYSNGVSVKTNGDALVTSSADGRNWTPVTALGTSSDEVFPAIAAFAGRVAVTYYTRTYDRNGIGLDYAYQAGWGDGVAHGGVKRITTQTANPQVQFVAVGAVSGQVLQGVFIGDYTAVAIGSDLRIHPCWTDFRGKPGTTLPNQDVDTQSISVLP